MQRHPMKIMKPRGHHLVILSLLIAGYSKADYQSTILADNPAGYWRLNSLTPVPAPTNAANLGSLGAAGQGVFAGPTLLRQPGAIVASTDTSMHTAFGTVTVPYDAALNVSGPFTIEAWAAPGGRGDLTCVVSSQEPITSNFPGYSISQTIAGAWRFTLSDAIGSVATITGGTWASGQWSHLAGVFDGTTATFFVDGVQVGSVATSRPFTPSTSAPFKIGATGSNARYFQGRIDEVAYYPAALGAAVIADHNANGRSAAPATPYQDLVLASSPAGYWRLNEAEQHATTPNSGSLGTLGRGYAVVPPATGTTGALISDADTSMTFNGTSTKIDVPNNTGLNGTSYSIECWVRMNGGSGRHRSPLSSREDVPAGTTGGYIFYADPTDNWQFWNGTGGVGGSWGVQTGPAVNDGVWTHLVGTIGNGEKAFYVNGVLVACGTVANYVPNLARVLRIGAGATEGTGNFFFPGDIDEVAVYPTVLSGDRVFAHYKEATGMDPASVGAVIVTQPQAVNAFVGDTVTLRAKATGSLPMTFTWYRSGTAAPVGTGQTLTLTNAQEAQSGDYTVEISNSAGPVISDPATVLVQPVTPPVITVQPLPVAVYPGGTARFSVQATGAQSLTYQWQKGTDNLPGQTSATLTLTGVSAASAGNYRCIVTSSAGSTPSDAAALSIIPLATGSYAAEVVGAGAVGYWRLGETTGTIAYDSIGGNNGEYIGGVTQGTAGALIGSTDTAGTFPGGGAKIDVPFSAALNTPVFSFECWAMVMGGAGTYRSPITSRDDSPQRGFIIYASNSNRWEFWNGTGAQTGWLVVNGPAVVEGQWYHLAATYNGTTKTFYVNGQQVGQANVAYAVNTARPLRIGGGATEGGGDFFFNGDIDEVAVYNRVLTGDEVCRHYLAGQGLAPSTQAVITPISSGSVALPALATTAFDTESDFTVETPAPSGETEWVFNAGSWSSLGQSNAAGSDNVSYLISPEYTATAAGLVTLTFSHRYSFEGDFWDGGNVEVSVNNGTWMRVSGPSFTAGGYNGQLRSDTAARLAGRQAFVLDSPGHPAFITSSCALIGAAAGDKIRVRFTASYDNNTTGAGTPTGWEIDSLSVFQGKAGASVLCPCGTLQHSANLQSPWLDITGRDPVVLDTSAAPKWFFRTKP